jgi:uncharacterized integral membrane protein
MRIAQTISNILMFIGFIGILNNPVINPVGITFYLVMVTGILISVSLDIIRCFKTKKRNKILKRKFEEKKHE